MNAHTLSRTRKTALHISVILIMLAAMMLILSAHTFATSSGVKGSAQVNSPNGVYLRKSSTTSSKKIALLPDNTDIVIYREVFKSKKSTAKKKVWYYVKANGKKGYIRSDNVDNVQLNAVAGIIKSKAAYRKGPGVKMKKRGTLKKGTSVTVYLDARPVSSTKGSSKTWYKVKVNDKYAYVCSSRIDLSGAKVDQAAVDNSPGITANAFSSMTSAEFESYLSSQGFPESYKVKLRALHEKHPNWIFMAYNTGVSWTDAMKKETAYGVSLIYKSYPTSYRSTSTNSFSSYSMAASASNAEETADPEKEIPEIEVPEENAIEEGAVSEQVVPEQTDMPAENEIAASDEEQVQEELSAENAAEEEVSAAQQEPTGGIEDIQETPGDTPAEITDSGDISSIDAPVLESVADEAKNAYYEVEPGWYNANANVVAYYLDPRNFINEDRIYMFEELAYRSEYQTASVVDKIIGNTGLPGYGFTSAVFINAGAANNISPVFLATRVVLETGGNSVSVNGSKSGGTVVYNPFNIGAYGSNPAAQGLAYAKSMGWTTPAIAVNAGAAYLANGYINKRQNTIYFQRFNVANGLSKIGTHQYMTNIMAPYSEAHITKTSYTQLGITNEPLGFIIPIYSDMPSQTSLP